MSKIFHYTFSTYNRKHILTDEVSEKLKQLFGEIATEKGFEIICFGILLDHVHILIKKKDIDRNEYIMKMIKGISSNRIFKEFPTNRLEIRKLWSRGYRAFEIKDEIQLKAVVEYVNNQKVGGIDKRAEPNWKPRRLAAGFRRSLR